MEKQTFIKNPLWTFALLATALVIGFLLMEGWLYNVKPLPETQDAEYRTSLSEAVQIFNNRHDQLLNDSQNLANRLEAQLQAGMETQNLSRYFQQYQSFWGATLFRGSLSQVWSGFSFPNYPAQHLPNTSLTDDPFVDVIKQNNVILLLCRIPIAVEGTSRTTNYELITTSRIQQTNALPIGQNHEYSLLSEYSESLTYPVELSFFEALPDSVLGFNQLSTASNDSAGIVFAPPDKFGTASRQWNQKAWFWRSLFSVLACICIVLCLYVWFGRWRGWHALGLQLFTVGCLWIFLSYLNIPGNWVAHLESGSPVSNINLSLLARNSLFSFLIAETIARFLRRRNDHFKESNFLRINFNAAVFGLVNAGIITGIIGINYQIIVNTELSLFDLQIFPVFSTFILYISLGLLLFSLVYGVSAVARYLIKLEDESSKLILIMSTTGFLIGLFFLQLYLPPSLSLNWVTWVSIGIFFGIIGIAALKIRFPHFVNSFSVMRAVTLASFLIALLGYPILKNAQYSKVDIELEQHARSFQQREDSTARSITGEILSKLQNRISGTTPKELDERVPYLQSAFTQTIEQTLTPEWRTYSLNLQLIKPSGTVVADYSTDLNAPNWTTVFDLRYLSAATEIERITKNNNRPIVQLPQLENSAKYETFYRGWIPIFSPDSNEQIAWILCSVYREHPDFNKPIRAVLASLTYSDWEDSFLLLEYHDGELERSSKQGLIGRFPTYHELRQPELDALTRDSVIYYTSTNMGQTYRNILLQSDGARVIKASTLYPSTNNVLFSFFRFSFSLLLAGLICIPLYLVITTGWSAFGRSKLVQRFEHRILDSFLVATLLFFGLLIAATHYAIKEQNKEIVQQELFDRLDELASIAQNDPQYINRIESASTSFSLQNLVSPMNVDAAFYKNKFLSESTTPQIYQQNLLPSTLPFNIYSDLFLRKKSQSTGTVRLASQNLLIGYQSLMSSEGEPIAVLAIPTFLESPKYDQQLLETTSYLIVFYLFTFGIFILATTLIAKQLTKPLRSIQAGLNKISEGNLSTTIPVKSNDEIGALAQAYNEMVAKLKQVRKELAIAEREAAWKEMAQQVAHEIKNPLTPMKLNVQHLERQLGNGVQDMEQLTANIKKITRNLTEQIQTLNNIASDFSKFSKPIDQEFTKVDLNEVARSVAELYEQDEKIDISVKLTEYPIHVNGVKGELRRVFINLVKNSFEALPESGGQINIKSYIKQDSAFFEVEDNGDGIPEEDKPKIFVPNFSTKSSGTGLGLAICKKIVGAHEGSITFASIEGNGTTFIIKLPLRKK